MPAEFHLYNTTTPDGRPRQLLSVLSPDDLQGRPLPEPAIIGHFLGPADALTPDTFVTNPLFEAFVQWVVAMHAATMPELLEKAAGLGDGYVAVVDQRSAGGHFSVPEEDVLGSFEVRGGKVAGYRINARHQTLTKDGLVELEGPLLAALLRELRTLARGDAP